MIEIHINSLFNSVSYKIGNIIIDPGDEWEGFTNVKAILLTHAHFDHIYGLNKTIELNPEAIVFTNKEGREMLLDSKLNLSSYHESSFIFNYPENIIIVKDNDIMDFGEALKVEIYETPGHNPSCLSFIIGDYIFTGDSYIPGCKTVTNLPNGDKILAEKSIEKILNLAHNKIIMPGHKI